MRITVVASSYPRYPGDGAAPFVQSICEHLQSVGHAVQVVAPYDAEVKPDPAARVPVYRFRYALRDRWHIMGHARSLAGDMRFRPGVFLLAPVFALAEFWAVLAAARRQHADIIHAHWVLPNGLIAAAVARILRVPLAISLHGSDVFVARRNRILGSLAGWAFRQARVVTACSPELAEGARALGAAPERTHIVLWGADPERFSPGVEPWNRRMFGLGEDDLIVAALGRVVPKKGFDVLIRALPALVAACPNLHVVIGGAGPQTSELQDLARRLGVADHLHLPGLVAWDRVPGFLAMSDIFVLPSAPDPAGNSDALPTVLFEAMGVGKPIIATTVGGVKLVLDAKTLCQPGDPAALAAAILPLARDAALRTALGHQARAAVEARYNWLAVARELTGLFAATSRQQRHVTGEEDGRYAPRAKKAAKIQHILMDYLGREGRDTESGMAEPAALRCLDLGCGSGIIAARLSETFGSVVGLDNAIEFSAAAQGPRFVRGDGLRLPFADSAFDVVICAQVYEHIGDARRMADEVGRILKPGGIVFFSGPNRLALVEDHYRLPFLSWLTRSAADFYMRLMHRGARYDVTPLTLWQLKDLWRGFEITDYTSAMLRQPARYGLVARAHPLDWLMRLVGPTLGPIAWLLRPLLPNYNWILRRPFDQAAHSPSQPVPSEWYTEAYFLTECEGFSEFINTRGQEVSRRVAKVTDLLHLCPGMRLLDVGAGRGELLLQATAQGASCVGIDYAPGALALARQGLNSARTGEESLGALPALVRADAKALPFRDGAFDRAVMSDVVEHLHPWELQLALENVARLLAPRGRLIVHTMPNTWYYQFGYPLFRFVQRLRGIRTPANPKARWRYADVHVNEQNPHTLKRALASAGLAGRVWVEDYRDYAYERGLMRSAMLTITRLPVLRLIFCDDIFAVAGRARRAKGERI